MNRKTSNKEFPRKFDLEERLITFSVSILKIADNLPSSYAGRHFAGQIIRSGTSPALNYGEAQSAESRKYFIHKMKLSLKELRETHVSLQIILRKPLIKDTGVLKSLISENDELVAIFVKSVATAQKKLKREITSSFIIPCSILVIQKLYISAHHLKAD